MANSAHIPKPRRQQRGVTIRSDRALARLALLTRDGRSQVDVIEAALDRMPLPVSPDRAAIRAEIDALLASVPRRKYPGMAELDAENFDGDGNLR